MGERTCLRSVRMLESIDFVRLTASIRCTLSINWINSNHGFLGYSWIYALILALDANFRLKNKDRGIQNDLPLNDGWGHWPPKTPFDEYLAKYGFQAEVSSGSSLQGSW